jgi:lysophospholipase L1-like esterase
MKILNLPLVFAAMALSSCNGGRENGEIDANANTSAEKLARCSVVTRIPADQHMVTSWKTAPTDALVTHPITALTVRESFAPHRDGALMRLRLSNRYSDLPVTLENVHIAKEAVPGKADMLPGSECLLTFAGGSRLTIAAGESVLSDTIAYPIHAFERVGISFFAPEATVQITRHLSANEYLYISLPGDHAADSSGSAFQQVPDGYASNFLTIEALEVSAPQVVTTLVAVGDSITDGSASTTAFKDAGPSPMTATDQRYPDHLQRRIDLANLPLTVANAGIGGNELLHTGWLPQFGVSLLQRLDYDVLAVTGVSHVLAMIGTNDFGNPRLGPTPSSEDMIAGYTQLIDRVHAAGLKIILGTIPPAEGAVTDGLPVVGSLPVGVGVLHGTAEARRGRDTVNAWIRQQNLSDGVVDFAACLEDPERPGYLAPKYNSGDNLHPNPAGYAAMAQCVDLELFRTPLPAPNR